jgi:hypothetical protein
MGATQYRIFRSFVSPPPVPVSADADLTGTILIPHMGQAPVWSVTTNGCMGHVYCFSPSAIVPLAPISWEPCIPLFIIQ